MKVLKKTYVYFNLKNVISQKFEKMESWNWVVNNFDVLFSGLGVYVLSLIVGIIVFVVFKSKKSLNKTSMKNITAGRDVVGRDKNN
jgi:ABC-type phosphate transport system permease subunit|tara:strand:+ start:1819 stop:2076 length:258 start_codon:yes stop_codon:yes gene_type:complete